jgi:excisionase family DNA binding protein
MTPEDLDLAAAIRTILRNPLVRAEIAAIVAEVRPREPARAFLSTAEAAAELGIKRDTVLSWIAAKKLPAVRLPGGRGLRIAREDLDAVLRAGGPPVHSEAAPVDLQARRGELARRLADSVSAKRSLEAA